MQVRKVRTKDAVGIPLAHDVTEVVPGVFKGPAFSRGHVIQQDDVGKLLRIGKEHVYTLQIEPGEVHEEEAAIRISRALAGCGLKPTEPREGRVDLIADVGGVARIKVNALNAINSLGDILVATVHDGTVCSPGSPVAGTRIVPLCIREEQLEALDRIASLAAPVIAVTPFKLRSVGIVVTGSEISKGLIQDRFSDVLCRKVEAFGCPVDHQIVVPDDPRRIAAAIVDFEQKGCEIILCTSGMSVDPDDATPSGIRRSGARVRFYGLPVFPGAMFLYARLRQTDILGVPACVLHSQATAFDRLFPALLTGSELTVDDARGLGHGGLCLHCPECHYPVCPFCK